MNLEIANRLVEYRKRAGYSQEELADKLGISRQAVSKWERVEASPDTDNLIALANLYGVSLDELINGKKEPEVNTTKPNEEPKAEKVEPEQEFAEEGIHIGGGQGVRLDGGDGSYVHINNDGIHVKKKNGDEKHYTEEDLERKCRENVPTCVGIAYPICAGVATILFFVFGFLKMRMPYFDFEAAKFVLSEPMYGFTWSWIFFVFIPVIPSFIHAIASKKFTKFCYPAFATSIFLYIGMICHLWHPGWIIFLTVPLFYSIFGPIDAANTRRRAKKLGVQPSEIDPDYDDDKDED